MLKTNNGSAKSLFVALIVCFSPIALASDIKVQWHFYLIAIAVVSLVAAWWVTSRKSYENRSIKFLAGSVYFWVFTFFQTIIWALVFALSS